MNCFHLAVLDGSLQLLLSLPADFLYPHFYYTVSTASLTYRAQRQLSLTRKKPSGSKQLGKRSEVGRFNSCGQLITCRCDVMTGVNTSCRSIELETYVKLPGRQSEYQDISTHPSTAQTTVSAARTAGDRLTVATARRRYSASTGFARLLQGMMFFCISTLALYFASDMNTQCIIIKSICCP